MIKIRNSIRQSSTAPLTLKHEIRKLEQLQQQLEVEANRAIEVLHKEVECHKHGNQGVAETIAKLQAEIREMQSVRPENRDVEMITDEGNGSDLKDEISRLHMRDNDIAKLEAKLENVQRSIDKLVMSLPNVGQLSCPPFTYVQNGDTYYISSTRYHLDEILIGCCFFVHLCCLMYTLTV
jgi:centromeric protein E